MKITDEAKNDYDRRTKNATTTSNKKTITMPDHGRDENNDDNYRMIMKMTMK